MAGMALLTLNEALQVPRSGDIICLLAPTFYAVGSNGDGEGGRECRRSTRMALGVLQTWPSSGVVMLDALRISGDA